MALESSSIVEYLNTSDSRCIYCKDSLKYPIRKIENVGNCCETCFDKSEYIHRRKSQELEYVVVNLMMPCKYSYRGCNEKGTVLVISRHEKKCIHRDKFCPYYELNKCNLVNHMPDLMLHFTEYHSSRIHVTASNCINLTYEISDHGLNEFWIIGFEDDNVFLNIKLKNGKVYFLVYYIGNTEDLRQLACKIEHQNNDIRTNKKTCKILQENDLGAVENEETVGVSFNSNMLENYFGKKLNVTITLERNIFSVSNDDILLRLECPICSNFMRTNIKLCVTGHSICNECESKLDKCPICTLPFYGARNFGLESVGDLLKTLIRGEKMECPLKKEFICLWKGNQSDIVEHVKDFHRDKIVINKTLMRVLDYKTEFSHVNYLMTYGQVFKVTCKKEKYDDLMAIIIELIGHDENAQRYYYNICFNSLYKQSIIWYTKSKVLARRRIEYYVDYIAVGRILCNNQFNISYTITKNKHQ